jgi:hypothetical protein
MAVVLKLGDFAFADNEIPERITMATKIGVVVRKMVGGARSVNMMGYDPQPLEWTGMLLGSNALQRARTLKQMTLAQKMLTLTFSEYSYVVVICDFVEDFAREYEIYYRIRLEVVADNAAQGGSTVPGIDTLIGSDISTANGICSKIGNTGLTSTMGTLTGAISAISSFATATKATLNTVLVPLAQASAQVKTLIAAGENTLQSVTTVGGLLPNNPIAQQVSRLSGQLNTMTQQPQLITLSGVLSRVSTNIGQLGSASNSITVVGGNLFDTAAKYYKDATGWVAISRANPQLKGDPNITGTQTIALPPTNTAAASDGVANA